MKPHYLVFTPILLLIACNNNTKTSQKAPDISCYPTRVTDKDWYASGKKAPRLEGLEGINFSISTKNKEAQEYFNQGMMLLYGFNHAEAARSFYEAARLDTTCAMAYWGYAYVLGPNYNGGMEEDNFQRAYEAAAKAKSLDAPCTGKEKALIHALTSRYAMPAPSDRKPLDIAYAASMKKVYEQYPADPDIGALYAEALMDIHPWDLYEKKTKKPHPWTQELLAVLEHLIKLNPRHPGAHHFYIHALEASATPEKALPSARALDTLVPGAGHLVHMPSHIYINTGDYHAGALSNIRAVEVDSSYAAACHAQGAYPLAYYPHNYHFLAALATLEGNSAMAWKAAKKLQEHTAQDIMHLPEWGTLQHYYTIPYYVAVKFGMWDTILSIPAPPKDLVYPRAIRHYARGMALLGKNSISGAKAELDKLKTLAADTILQHITVWDINTTADLVQIALKVLSAKAAVKNNDPAAAIALLREAVAIEDDLNYNEPPDWFFSVRHYLGTVLLDAGKYREAESVYREDLQTWKKNGWALIGLYHSLVAQNKNSEAEKIKPAFDEAWRFADVEPHHPAFQTSVKPLSIVNAEPGTKSR
ncbi:tetratricopeptide repeat protein [Chitinophaga cymbidii]|uniref:Tetratricopeptide repeat protein n=1 Tax=Chitinophaga cymbidii TaxID=1096750 RepID=A0A512RN14_9BACT|nr:hypothetical protein [Chitinophaga cymbidii]GEP97096.1 hypothetical protein CCY01nite_33560 [Chitinophaga cymbidii]